MSEQFKKLISNCIFSSQEAASISKKKSKDAAKDAARKAKVRREIEARLDAKLLGVDYSDTVVRACKCCGVDISSRPVSAKFCTDRCRKRQWKRNKKGR